MRRNRKVSHDCNPMPAGCGKAADGSFIKYMTTTLMEAEGGDDIRCFQARLLNRKAKILSPD